MSVNGNPMSTGLTPNQRHPLLEALHRELGVARVKPEEVIAAGKRWLLRPLTFDDQVWATSKLRGGDAGDNFLIYASQVAMSVAAVGELALSTITTKKALQNPDGSPRLREDGTPEEVEIDEFAPLPPASQPAMVPAIQLFPPIFPPSISIAVASGLQAAPVFIGDPLDPPNPWRELVADQVFAFLRGISPSVARDLFFEQTRIQERTEVPPLPLPRPSQKPTTT